jgi:hypothetical protein
LTSLLRPKHLFFLAALAGGFLAAGDGRCGDVQYQTWIDYNPSWKASERVTVFGDAGIRRNYVDPRWWKYVLRANIGYDLGAWKVAGGIGNFYSDFAGVLHIYELRPWQGALVYWPASGLRLAHLFRLEERFFFDTDDGNSLFRMRLRYQLGTRVDWSRSESGRGWNSPISVELFFQFDDDADERFGEQARISAGIERVFNPRLRVGFDLLWQNTAQLTDFYSGNELYFRLRFFQSF